MEKKDLNQKEILRIYVYNRWLSLFLENVFPNMQFLPLLSFSAFLWSSLKKWVEKERERERESDRDTDRNRERQRETDRQTDRQRKREKKKWRERE